jgi:uncharacterized membrane protein
MLLLAVGRDSNGYKVVEILHIFSVIVGFGSLYAGSVYAALGRKRGGRDQAAISRASEFVLSRVSLAAIIAVPIFGFALVGMSDKQIKFSQGWLSASFAIYLVILVILLGAVRPAHRHLNELLEHDSPDVGSITAIDRRLAAASGVNHLLVAVVLCLMVLGPK